MAENPFVDGITNLAIPNSPYGVDLSSCEIPGYLYGIKSKIKDNVYLTEMNVGKDVKLNGMEINKKRGEKFEVHLSLSGSNIKGNAYLEEMSIDGSLLLNNVAIRKDLSLNNIDIRGAFITNEKTKIGGTFDIKNAKIAEYDGPEKLKFATIGATKSTEIPDSMKKALGLK